MAGDAIHFIVGMSRGGTTFMSKVLNTHPDVVSFGETAFFGRVWLGGDDGRLDADAVGHWRRALVEATWGPHEGKAGTLRHVNGDRWPEIVERRLVPLAGGATASEAFAALADCFREAEGKTVAVEKTPHHLGYVDRILEAVPGARFVLMRRDAEPFLRSYKHQGGQWGGERRRRAAGLYHPIPTSLIWRGYARQADDVLRRHGGRVLAVTLDDLRDDEAGTLERVQEHLGLRVVDLAGNVPPDNSSFGKGGGPRPGLSAADRWWLHRLAGRESGGSAPLTPAAAWPALTLPVWLARNALRLRRGVKGSLWRYAARYLR